VDSGPLAAKDGYARLIDSAAAVVRWHVAEPGGLCTGCLRSWDRSVWFPCEQASWAHAVLDRHGDTDRDLGRDHERNDPTALTELPSCCGLTPT